MYGLIFRDLPDFSVGMNQYPKLDYAFKGAKANLEKMVSHERRSSKAVRSDHPLLGLINSISSIDEDNLRLYYMSVKDAAVEWAAARGITTSSKVNRPFLGDWLGGNDLEFVTATNGDIDWGKVTNDVYQGWENLQPLKVVAAPEYDDSYPWILGECPYPRNGWAILSIDIPMFAVMYKSWLTGVMRSGEETTKASFLRNYVLANAIESFQEVKNLNRLYRLGQDLEVEHVRSDGDPALPDYELRLMKAQYSHVNDIKKLKLSWVEIMANTMLSADVHLKDKMQPFQDGETSQNRWLYLLAQLPLLKYLLLVDDNRSSANQDYRGRLKRTLQELSRDRGMYAMRDFNAINLIEAEFKSLAAQL